MTEYGRKERLFIHPHGKQDFLSIVAHVDLSELDSVARQTPHRSAFGSHCGSRQQCLLRDVALPAL
jgi:hypothetical protein